ncbi:MAG: hypothetical protein NT167_04820 [Verrucomicrobia bacterium]|nr:hypothetical protein [Verrucomicrobiota bacterium]
MTNYRRIRRDVVNDDEMPPEAGREKAGGKHVFSGETYDGNTSHD